MTPFHFLFRAVSIFNHVINFENLQSDQRGIGNETLDVSILLQPTCSCVGIVLCNAEACTDLGKITIKLFSHIPRQIEAETISENIFLTALRSR